jgi:hypothetical protein
LPHEPGHEEEQNNIFEAFINFLFNRGGGEPSAESLNPLDAASAGVGQPGAGLPQQAPVQPIIVNLPAPKALGGGGRSANADSTLEALAAARSRLAQDGAAPGSTRFTGTRANQAKQSGKESRRRSPELQDKQKIRKRRQSRARAS